MESARDEENNPLEPDAKRRHPGAVSVRGKRIIALRKKMGWSQKTLASRAGCSLSTVVSAELGKDAFTGTLEKLAKPFGVDHTEFIAGSGTLEAKLPGESNQTPKVKVKIYIQSNYEEFDETRLPELIAKIRQETGARGEITVVVVEEGSVIVTLVMDEEEATSLSLHLTQKPFPGYRISEVDIEIKTNYQKENLINELKRFIDIKAYSSINIGDYLPVIARFPSQDDTPFWREDGLNQHRDPIGRAASHRGVAASHRVEHPNPPGDNQQAGISRDKSDGVKTDKKNNTRRIILGDFHKILKYINLVVSGLSPYLMFLADQRIMSMKPPDVENPFHYIISIFFISVILFTNSINLYIIVNTKSKKYAIGLILFELINISSIAVICLHFAKS